MPENIYQIKIVYLQQGEEYFMNFETEVRVRYADTDQMGVVYHSNYFVWMEIGRTEFFRKNGFSYKEIEKNGILFPVVEASCKYKASAKYDDVIIIQVKIKKLSEVKVAIDYKMFRKEDNVLIAKGETVHGIISKDNNKPLKLNKIPWLKQVLNPLV